MYRAVGVSLALLMAAAACSAGGTNDVSTGLPPGSSAPSTSSEAVPATNLATESSGEVIATTLVSAANGGVVTFGEDVTLTVPAGALKADTEIGISTIPESDWPEELVGLEDAEVTGDFLRLSPDGLIFDEPAILSRRVTEVVRVADGKVSVSPSMSLSRSDGTWEALPQTVVIDDGGAVIETPIMHFSENVLVVKRNTLLVTVKLLPSALKRLVGDGFAVQLVVDPGIASIETDFWSVEFANDLMVTKSFFSPVEPIGPTHFRLRTSDPADKPRSSAFDFRSPVIAPAGTPMPLRFVAGFQCIAAGNAGLLADFTFNVRWLKEELRAFLDELLFDELSFQPLPLNESNPSSTDDTSLQDPGVYKVSGLLFNKTECVDKSDSLTPGLFGVTSDVASDPAGHSCCVKPPPRKARMTLGSLWFTDAKLGDSNRWQGLFFDSVPGSADDVMNGVNDSTESPPNTVEIELADDFDQTGRFSAEGVGTVAGFPGIRVRLEAVATDRGTWSGTLTKGVDGGLPTGQAIVYDISGSLIAPQPVAFVDQLAQAFRDGDSEFLLDHLHPDVLGLYAGACVSFTDGISSPDLDIAVHSFDDVADWTLTLDGNELTIPNAVNLDVTRTEAGEANRTVMHVAARPGDGPPSEMTWFADCGDPFPIG